MKTLTIFEKLISSDSATSGPGGDSHEFFAEQLESRILYSAAPAPVPDASVAVEASVQSAEVEFESIDSFKNAARDRSQIQEEGSIDTILTLTSFDEMALEEPVRFDTNPVAFRRWEGNFAVSENSNVEPGELSDVEIVSIDYYFGKQGRFEFNVDNNDQTQFEIVSESETNRIVAFGETAEVFGAEPLNRLTNVFGLGQIERSLEDWIEFVA